MYYAYAEAKTRPDASAALLKLCANCLTPDNRRLFIYRPLAAGASFHSTHPAKPDHPSGSAPPAQEQYATKLNAASIRKIPTNDPRCSGMHACIAGIYRHLPISLLFVILTMRRTCRAYAQSARDTSHTFSLSLETLAASPSHIEVRPRAYSVLFYRQPKVRTSSRLSAVHPIWRLFRI